MELDTTKLSPKQLKFIENLLNEPSFEQAYKKTHISKPTALKWRKMPEFKTIYEQRKEQVFDSAINKLMSNLGTTVDELVRIITDKTTSDTAKINASRLIIEYSFKGYENTQILARIEELESRLEDE